MARMPDREEVLRHLTLGDAAYIDRLVADRRRRRGDSGQWFRSDSLLRIGALAALDGPDVSWQQTVAAALGAGLTADEIVDALVALAPMIGSTRLVSIAPKVSLALGYDVEAAIEAPGPASR
jgi:hypothetical protein